MASSELGTNQNETSMLCSVILFIPNDVGLMWRYNFITILGGIKIYITESRMWAKYGKQNQEKKGEGWERQVSPMNTKISSCLIVLSQGLKLFFLLYLFFGVL
jgi:hypothetical protein